jgi:hypothetical protein
MDTIVFYILEGNGGWRIVSRAFAWDFKSKQEAIAFSLACARNYADGTGRPTSVRLQEEGAFRELFSHPGFARRTLPRPARTAQG